MSRNRKCAGYQEIARELRSSIIHGKYRTGEQLPTRKKIETMFSTTPNTVQKAFENLMSSGFISVRPNKGTYVAEHLPHLYNYAVLIRAKDEDPGWVNYWNVIRHVAEDFKDSSPYDFSIVSGVDREQDKSKFKKLVSDMENNVYGGIVFGFDPDLAGNTVLVRNREIPKVSLITHHVPGIPFISNDNYSLVKRALDYLKERGRKKVAVIFPDRFDPGIVRYFVEYTRTCGMSTCDSWMQSLNHHSHASWGANLVQLLFDAGKSARPDSLIIMDDNFVDSISAGIMRTGLQAEKDLDIVAHANFPLLKQTVIPMKRIGFDVRHILNTSLELFSTQRKGGKCPGKVTISPVFENENTEKTLAQKTD